MRTTTIVMLLLSAIFVTIVMFGVHIFNQRRIQSATQLEIDDVVAGITERLGLYEYGLRGLRGAVAMTGSDQISNQALDEYSKTRNIPSEFPGAKGFGYIQYVRETELKSFLDVFFQQNHFELKPRNLAPYQGDNYLIRYIYPLEPNLSALGLNIASESNRRLAADKAARTGKATLTGPITLVQDPTKRAQAFLFLLPLYDGGDPGDEQKRRQKLKGWSYAPLSMSQILDQVALTKDGIQTVVFDATDDEHGVLIFSSAGSSEKTYAAASLTKKFEAYGRIWKLQINFSESYIEGKKYISEWMALSTIMTLVLLLNLLGLSRYAQKKKNDELNQARLRLAAIVDSSVDGIIGKDLEGKVISWNSGAVHLFGYTAQEAIGAKILELIVPEDRYGEEKLILQQISDGHELRNFDTKRKTKNGNLIDVSVAVAPIFDDHGKVIGASKTVRDISVQVAASRLIEENNERLENEVQIRTAELENAKRTLRTVIDALPSMIGYWDKDLTNRVANKAYSTWFGVTPDELLGRKISDLLGPELFAKNLPHIEAVLSGMPQTFERDIKTPSGTKTSLAHYIPDEINNEVRGFFVIIHDISEVSAQRRELAVALDINQSQQALLRAANEQLELAADIAGLGVWNWDVNENIILCNKFMFTLYDIPDSNSSGIMNYTLWRSKVHPDDIDRVEKQLNAALDGLNSFNPQFRAILNNGEIKYIQAAALVQRNLNGQAIYITGINLDITQAHHYQQSLIISKQEAEQANKVKSQFLANMSHEIRTPLNAVLGMLQLLQRSNIGSRELEYVTKAKGAAQSLLSLLNDILDYSKIEADKIELDTQTFSLQDFLYELSVVLNGNIGTKNVEVLFDIDPQLPDVIQADKLRLQQILINLCGNALKFTEKGQVLLKLCRYSTSGREKGINFSVTDSGIGIREDKQKHIFEAFSQAESATTRQYGGTGLGLSISKRLVNLMGGDLQLVSKEGEGSKFWFELPLDLPAAPAPPLPSGITVLIVDDNHVAAEVLEFLCKSLGWNTKIVHSAIDAFEAIDTITSATGPGTRRFDVILMDWQMPEIDGLTAAKELYVRFPEDCPPIVMVSAFGQEHLRQLRKKEDSPIIGFLSKPVFRKDLLEKVTTAITATSDAVRNKLPDNQSDTKTYKRTLSGLRILAVEDNALNREVIRALLERSGAKVQLADGGLAGVEYAVNRMNELDVILMDIQMPDIDGLEATKRILERYKGSTVPIIAMTANVSPSDIAKSRAAGMADHLGKPIDIEEVERVILRCINLDTSEKSSTSSELQNDDLMTEPFEKIMRRFNQNVDVYKNALNQFNQGVRGIISEILDLIAEVPPDPAVIAGKFHAVKGIASTIGALQIARLSSQAESILRSEESGKSAQSVKVSETCENILAIMDLSIDQLQLQVPAAHADSANDILQNPELSDREFLEKLKELRILLSSSNARAIKLVASLEDQTSNERTQFLTQLSQLTSMLDFQHALSLVDEYISTFAYESS